MSPANSTVKETNDPVHNSAHSRVGEICMSRVSCPKHEYIHGAINPSRLRSYVPVPLRNIFCGLPPPLSLILMEAERAPVAVGVKVAVTVQLAPGPSVVPQVFVRPKSPAFVPVRVMLVMLRVVDPTFVMVDVIGALVVPTF